MTKTKITFDQCKLYYIDTAKYVAETPETVLSFGAPSVAASVPGNAELDLERAGILPELFNGCNILKLEEYELFEYWYELDFFARKTSERRISLLFEGIDTLADIWLNGEKIGSTNNMLIPHSFDVTDLLQNRNKLWVRIKNPVRFAEKQEYDTGLWGLSYNAESIHIRKAPHSFGWDICPRAIGGGIFRNVYLVEENAAEIFDVYMHTLCVDYQGAHVRLSYDLRVNAELYHKTYFELVGSCGEKTFIAGERVVFKHGMFNFTIPKEELLLWNPVGYGEANLYTVTARLKGCAGEILAEKTFRFGVRTVELKFDECGEKKEFLLKINGTPVLCKGTNWVPLDAYHSRDEERMERGLALLADCGCNSVRCWGGNLYEPDRFFEFCDEHGILVWQDVIMACNLYPSTEPFRAALEEELRSVLTRIRGHACLVCYCGDNECDLGMYFNGIDPSKYKVTRDYLPSLMFRFDPFRRFIPSSPFFAGRALRERDEQSLAENHLWGPRNYFKSKFYAENKNVFISEIGYHGCPSSESVKKFIPESALWPWENDDWMVHQTVPGGQWTKEWNRNKLMVRQVGELFGYVPDTLEEFSFYSQISQAEALKFFVELVRLRKWEKTGIFWWNLLDCWPQFSDAIVDYYFDKKLAYYYLKNVQKDLCFMLEDPVGWSARAVIGNDGNRSYINGEYEVIDGLTEKTVRRGTFDSKANENVVVCDVPLSQNVASYFILLLKADGKQWVNHYINYGGALDIEEYRTFLLHYAKYTDIPLKKYRL